MKERRVKLLALTLFVGALALMSVSALAQFPDRTRTPNAANEGIAKSLTQQIGAGRGSVLTPGSSLFIINRDPARAVRRGRQLFQRKFLRSQGAGPITGDGDGVALDINNTLIIGAGLADSCAACHGQPRGSAGAGGDVVTRPDSRNAPHLFGLGLKEMLADEITDDLRDIREDAIRDARRENRSMTRSLNSKGINYGSIRAFPSGNVDTSGVRGVDSDLRIRPFFLHGETISIREFLVGAFNAEMGLDSVDSDLMRASRGERITTPSGMVLDGDDDNIEAPPTDSTTADPDRDGVVNEIPTSLVDFMEFYLLHYFKAGLGEQNSSTATGRQVFSGNRLRSVPCARPQHRARSAYCGCGNSLRSSSRQSIQSDVRHRQPPASGGERWQRVPNLEEAAPGRFSRSKHLHRLQASRSWTELPRDQLQQHYENPDADDGAVGCWKHRTIWPRRSQHDPDRCDPASRWGSSNIA